MGRDKKDKKKKKKSRRQSDSDSDNSDGKRTQEISYEEELEKLKEERRRKKEFIKTNETPEERRMRRLAKKEAKEQKYNRLIGVDDMGYTNTDNPFGDNHLTESFVWKKKHELDGVKDIGSIEQRNRQKEKQRELKEELEKVKKRRKDREAEKLAREEEMTLMQREKEAAMFSSWSKQEDDFHLHQARLRSSIRIRDGRAKPIDMLAAYINPEEEDLEVQMHEPYAALIGLSIDDLEDLIEDIKIYITIDQKKNLEFWEDITTMVKDELDKLRKKRNEGSSSRREAVNTAVQSDVHSIFYGKSHSQLRALQKQMRQKIEAGGTIDVGYWESLLQQLKAFMSKARLKERHQGFLKNKLNELKMETAVEDDTELPSEHTYQRKEQPQEDEEEETEKEKEESDDDKFKKPAPVDEETLGEDEENKDDDEEEVDQKVELQKFTEAELSEQAMKDYEENDYEPRLMLFGDVEEEKWLDPTDDSNKLSYLREQVKAGSTVEEELEADNMFNTKVLHGMNENEEAFNTTVVLKTKKYNWSDKYRPRKPRFFNRVHTGYEWNKYNQTHYDQDNPPPKIVQGYKFNIFFPDLIDKTKTPEYTLTSCEDDPEFAILRFKAGPPYEDIAFKVVDREWECSNRHGFRCQFYNNIFQLYFHFKRYRYRR